jgi:pimeloyl-ACP methyl ester carboxylesterase
MAGKGGAKSSGTTSTNTKSSAENTNAGAKGAKDAKKKDAAPAKAAAGWLGRWSDTISYVAIPAMMLGQGLQLLTLYLLVYAELGAVSAPAAVSLPLPPVRARTEFYIQETVHFPARDGALLEAYLYLPRSGSAEPEDGALGALPPVVIMAHGMGAIKDMRLPDYAVRFAKAGMAVLLFDYRTFGGSQGEPRQQINPWDHVEDFESALDFVATDATMRGRVDSSRVALWGTSFAGGHVLVAGAGTHAANVRAVVSQVPFLDPDASGSRFGIIDRIRFAFIGTRDFAKRYMGWDRVYIPIYASSEDEYTSILTVAGDESQWARLKNGSFRAPWENKSTAAVYVHVAFYKPRQYAADVKAPVLMMAAPNDVLCPIDIVRDVAAALVHPESKLIEIDTTHFGFYLDDAFEQAITTQIKFLQRHLGVSAA